eukprot:TRINITY_DN29088_c0_g1_i1.p1 TRINITY_DN29088_c0_g1~~TRINITY_DN29088_c0_g1_i1.p1  ORF type:complete len:281 (+),score=35.13 TRINITY_DN29088_c0_g1_i1:57-899(+)
MRACQVLVCAAAVAGYDLGKLDLGTDQLDSVIPEEATRRTGFQFYMRCDTCRVLVTELIRVSAARRPHDGLTEKKIAKFFRDEIRADEIIEDAVVAATGDWQFVEYPDMHQTPGAMGVYVRFDDLMAANEHSKPGVRATLEREKNFRDPGMLNFLRTFAETHEERIHRLLFRDELDFDRWMDDVCIAASGVCRRASEGSGNEQRRKAVGSNPSGTAGADFLSSGKGGSGHSKAPPPAQRKAGDHTAETVRYACVRGRCAPTSVGGVSFSDCQSLCDRKKL